MANYSGNSLLTGIYSGLTNTYSYLAQLNPNGVTLDSISSARTDSKNSLNLNQSFASYLQTNFNSIDVDGDGIIGSNEITDYTNTLSTQGLTRTELTQLAASGASGLSSDTINNILEHFDEMDTNGDGRITSAEISAFSYGAARQEKLDEYNHQKATNMSTFYGSDSSSSVDSYSMLSYRYKNINK
ncbi:EF-hand domain-containing protein [bacterium]|nr:EF-hand domain-containing protein [bacterium]